VLVHGPRVFCVCVCACVREKECVGVGEGANEIIPIFRTEVRRCAVVVLLVVHGALPVCMCVCMCMRACVRMCIYSCEDEHGWLLRSIAYVVNERVVPQPGVCACA